MLGLRYSQNLYDLTLKLLANHKPRKKVVHMVMPLGDGWRATDISWPLRIIESLHPFFFNLFSCTTLGPP
jgi:hypothetical protein